MLKIKKSNERGYSENKWLKSYHSFSFANYYNPNEINYSHLRVINDDTIAPNYGFSQHPHKNMEIFTYLISGNLAHKDTMRNVEIIKSGDVQIMSTGYGVEHSEFNPSNEESVRLLQIWIQPNTKDTLPTYQQKSFSKEDKLNKLKLIISESGFENSLIIKQDVEVFASILEKNKVLNYKTKPERQIYIQVVTGSVSINDINLFDGDALEVKNENLIIKGNEESEFLILDLKKI